MGLFGSNPEPPDYAAQAYQDAIQGAHAEFENFPFQREIEAAAALGKKVTIDGKTYDFTGLGDTQYNIESARKLSDALLKIRAQYGEDYVREQLKQLDLAQPEVQDARRKQFDRIMAEIGRDPNRQLADSSEESVLRRLREGGKLSAGETRAVQQGVRGPQVDNGLFLGNAANAAEAGSMLSAGDNKRQTAQQMALQWLGSGATPEDFDYRKLQTDIGNLSSFARNETPIAQFGSISGAQNGAVPFATDFQGSGLPGSSANTSFANAVRGQQSQWNLNTPNPWTTGIGFALQGASVYGNLGGFGKPAAPSAYPGYGVSYNQPSSIGANLTPGNFAATASVKY